MGNGKVFFDFRHAFFANEDFQCAFFDLFEIKPYGTYIEKFEVYRHGDDGDLEVVDIPKSNWVNQMVQFQKYISTASKSYELLKEYDWVMDKIIADSFMIVVKDGKFGVYDIVEKVLNIPCIYNSITYDKQSLQFKVSS